MRITILGAGSFGTAMAKHLADIGNDILMWTIDPVQSESINRFRCNSFVFRTQSFHKT